MNKLTKGIIAAAAGIILLSGGAGTFAAWNSQATIAGGTVNTGQLEVETTGTGTWADQTGTPVAAPTLASYVFAPGDELTFTQDVLVTVRGAHLVGNLSALIPGITNTTGTAAAGFDVTATFGTPTAGNGAVIANGTANGSYDISAASSSATSTATVPVTVDIKFLGTADNSTQLGSVKLSDISIDLTQIAAATATPIPAPTASN